MSEFTEQQINFMRQACLLCDNSSLKVRTGCVLVKGDKVIAGGWNRKDLNGEFSDEVMHSEEMAFAKSLTSGVSLTGAIIYVTRFPCERCSQKLVEQGITKIFYMSDHFTGGNKSLGFLRERGIEVIQIPEEEVWNS